MAEVKWIKIVTDIFDDEKILLIESLPDSDAIIVLWFKLLCLAGKNNNSGVFTLNEKIPYTEEMFATIFRKPLNTVRLALRTFEDFGMVEIVNGIVTIPNWGKHQNFDRIEQKNEYMRNYMQEYRKKQKLLTSGDCKVNDESNSKSNVSEAEEEGEGEEDKSTIRTYDSEPPKTEPTSVFRAPSIEAVKEYCKENSLIVDAEWFFKYYQDRKWMTKEGPMRDWKAALNHWHEQDLKKPRKNKVKPTITGMAKKKYGDVVE